MVRRIARFLLGPTLTGVVSTGITTLRHYPRYVFGGGRAGRLSRIDLEITFGCNARCRMCPLYGEHMDNRRTVRKARGRRELTTNEIKDLLRQGRSLGTEQIVFTGGEPFLRKDLCNLVDYAKRQGMHTSVITNGSVLSEELAHDIVAVGLNSMSISLDGPEEVHNSIRRVANMFARIERSLSFLRAAQDKLNRVWPIISLGCTVSALNQGHLHELVDTAAKWKTCLSFSPIFYCTSSQEEATQKMYPAGDVKPEDWQLPDHFRNVDVELLAKELAYVRKKSQDHNIELYLGMAERKHIRNHYYDPFYADNNKCLYPWYAARVNPYGDVYPCSILVNMGNILDQSLESIWNGLPYVRFRKKLRDVGLFPKCAKCCVLNRHDVIRRLLPRMSLRRTLRPRTHRSY